MRALMLQIYARGRLFYRANALVPGLASFPERKGVVRLSDLVQRLQSAYQMTTAGRFQEACAAFRTLLQESLFVEAKGGAEEAKEVQQLQEICREYLVGLLLETERKAGAAKTDQKRSCEMAAYFTHCRLQPVHLLLTLRTAANLLFKARCFKSAGGMARRLLELGPKPETAQHARKILAQVDKNPTDELELRYDAHNPFALCAASFTPLYRGTPQLHCPLCKASYDPEFTESVCRVCLLSQIGLKNCTGLHLQRR